MNKFIPIFVVLISSIAADALFAQAKEQSKPEMEPRSAPDAHVLDEEQWEQLDDSLKRALTWLATQQKKDGSFNSPDSGQPAITALCLMAFMAQGESPADGQYQQQLAKAVDFIADQQKPNGLIATTAPNGIPISRQVHKTVGSPSVYNHAISALALCEAYGQCSPEQAERLTPVIEKAIAATLEMQQWEPKHEKDVGGWRYLDLRLKFRDEDSDLSITGWQLMFLRSAKDAGFAVPDKSIDAAVKYVENCFLVDEDRQVHAYLGRRRAACTRAMAGAGVLALAHAGKHGSKEALASGDWILKHDFSNYNDDAPIYGLSWSEEHYHYASVICTQAMFQLGGKYWTQFFPPLVDTLLANQQPSGAWPPEKAEPKYGNTYPTALCILSLSVPNQMLPIFQR